MSFKARSLYASACGYSRLAEGMGDTTSVATFLSSFVGREKVNGWKVRHRAYQSNKETRVVEVVGVNNDS